MGDRITVLVAAGAISATLGTGSCSTNTRIDDVKMQLNTRIDDVNFGVVNNAQALLAELLGVSSSYLVSTVIGCDEVEPTRLASEVSPDAAVMLGPRSAISFVGS